MNTLTLTPDELAVLKQLFVKPTQVHHLDFSGFYEVLQLWQSWAKLQRYGLMRTVEYWQEWRTPGFMTICHLTHAGRMALLAHEKQPPRFPEKRWYGKGFYESLQDGEIDLTGIKTQQDGTV